MPYYKPEDRSAHAERMRAHWASLTPEQRAERGRRISEGQRRATTPEHRKAVAQKARLSDLVHTSRADRAERGRKSVSTTLRRIAEEIDPEHAMPEDERLERAGYEWRLRLAEARRLSAIRKKGKAQQSVTNP